MCVLKKNALKWPWPFPPSTLPKAVRKTVSLADGRSGSVSGVCGIGSAGGKVSPLGTAKQESTAFPARAGVRSRSQRHRLWTQDGTPADPDHTDDLESGSASVCSSFISCVSGDRRRAGRSLSLFMSVIISMKK